jgi:hypothetical protein
MLRRDREVLTGLRDRIQRLLPAVATAVAIAE